MLLGNFLCLFYSFFKITMIVLVTKFWDYINAHKLHLCTNFQHETPMKNTETHKPWVSTVLISSEFCLLLCCVVLFSNTNTLSSLMRELSQQTCSIIWSPDGGFQLISYVISLLISVCGLFQHSCTIIMQLSANSFVVHFHLKINKSKVRFGWERDQTIYSL